MVTIQKIFNYKMKVYEIDLVSVSFFGGVWAASSAGSRVAVRKRRRIIDDDDSDKENDDNE